MYGNKYDYSKVNYVNSRTPISLICNIHKEEFNVLANSALQSRCNCPKCQVLFPDVETFIKKAREKHGDKYDYSKIKNIDNGNSKVTIICPIHGEFQ